MSLYSKLQLVVAEWAADESRTEASRLRLAREFYPATIKPCEACGRREVTPGGICPECLSIIAAGLAILAKGRR